MNKKYPVRTYQHINDIISDGDLPKELRSNVIFTYQAMTQRKNQYALFTANKMVNSYVQNQAKQKNEVQGNYKK